MQTETQISQIYNYTARVHDLILDIYDAKLSMFNSINVFETENKSGVSIIGLDEPIIIDRKNIVKADVNAPHRYYSLCRDLTDVYDDFFEEIKTTPGSMDAIIYGVNNFLISGYGSLLPNQVANVTEEMRNFRFLISKLEEFSKNIGPTYKIIENEKLEYAYGKVENLYTIFHDMSFNTDFLNPLFSAIESYELLGFNALESRIEPALILALGKIKILFEVYEEFKGNHKIISLLVEIVSFFSSLGVITGILAIGQGIVKLFPDSENLTKEEIELMAKIADIS